MKFAIITHVVHKKDQDLLYAYEPYIREMNLWLKYVTSAKIVAPCLNDEPEAIESAYVGNDLEIKSVKSFNLKSLKSLVLAIFNFPRTLLKIYNTMVWADHIHIRCPGNIGLLGCFVQTFFPKKIKTIKYAGNWDPSSKQPWSYKLQKWWINNTFLTRNSTVLVYGSWPGQSKNIKPFFTASYHSNEIEPIDIRSLSRGIKFVFVGAFVQGKRPMLSVKVVEKLNKIGVKATLDLYGNGIEKMKIKKYIEENNLEEQIHLFGNVNSTVIKKAFQNAHFNLFLSKSEGWPKVVAEGMFWGCLPITTKVSCVSDMLENGNRGCIVAPKIDEITNQILTLINDEETYRYKVLNAMDWSRIFTIDYYENEIKKLLND